MKLPNPVVPVASRTPLQELWDKCNAHDWRFEYSDDAEKYWAGQYDWQDISHLASITPGGKKMLKAWDIYHSVPQSTKPKRP